MVTDRDDGGERLERPFGRWAGERPEEGEEDARPAARPPCAAESAHSGRVSSPR